MSDNDHRISKAPPPPTIRLSGTRGGPLKPRNQAPIAPDWSFWPPSRPVAPWQAVALSLNLDPYSLKHSPHRWMAGPGARPSFLSESFPDAETETSFDKRIDLLASYRPSHEELLTLQDFATWAAFVNLAPISPELDAYAIKDTTQAAEVPATPATEPAQSEAIAPSTIETPPAWDTLTLEEKKASWDAMTPDGRREKAHELVKKHDGNKTRAAAEVGISPQAFRRYIEEAKPEETEAPLPVNMWTQTLGLVKPKRGKASR